MSQGGNELTARWKTTCALLITGALFFSTVAAAFAVPASKLDQARRVKAQIDALDTRVEIASERYNEASAKHATLDAKKKKAYSRLKKVEKRMGVVQKHLNTRANSMYRAGQLGFVEVLVGAQSFEEFATTWDVLRDLNDSDAQSVGELKNLRGEYKSAHKDLRAKEQAAAKQVSIMAANQRSIEGQLAERKRKLSGIESQIAALEAAEEAARRVRAASFTSRGGGGGSSNNFPPPSRKARAEIVPYAMKFLGTPYKWGATGPNSFDCSGFTSYVYRNAAGISLPRVSRAQIGAGERVSRKDLQPGDLVFFGSPIHHVGIYVGGGRYIHAPHTGAVVRVDSMDRGGYAGACRP